MDESKRILVTTGGGLGNQILQYALWLYLRNNGYKSSLILRINDLIKIFSVPMPSASTLDRKLIKYRSEIQYCYDVVSWFKERKRYRKCPVVFSTRVVDFPQWEDYKFISDIKDELIGKLRFPVDEDKRNLELKSLMTSTNSVSIHVRRGDYQNTIKWRMALGDICDKDYYERAIQKAKELVNEPRFFVFSDDISWVKENLEIEDPLYVDWNNGSNSFRDMELMMCCKVNIIANSTFSLCAAYLNINENPIRIAPQKWRNVYNDNLKDKYIDSRDWILIDNERPQITIRSDHNLSAREILNLKRQSYTDIEVLTDAEVEGDNRFHSCGATGRYIYDYTQKDVALFENRRYLWYWLKGIYEKELSNNE